MQDFLREIADNMDAGLVQIDPGQSLDFDASAGHITISALDPNEEMLRAMREAALEGFITLTRHFGGLSWREKVDEDILQMSNVRNCTSGQVFGSFEKARKIFAPDEDTSLGGRMGELGFTLPQKYAYGVPDGVTLQPWIVLGEAWKELLDV
jgi:hypothetical protein